MKIGFIGLGKMGMHMAHRLVKAGIEVAGYDISSDNLRAAADCGVIPCESMEQMCATLSAPRIVWIQAPAGKITNDLVASVANKLSPGDVVVDGGNSDFRDSLRNANALMEKGIHFVDAGVSGGVAGAKNGCGLLVGADDCDFTLLTPVFQALAAPNGYVHVGNVGAGHFAKMVHNGVEYAIMEAYAEGYELLKKSDLKVNVLETMRAYQNGCSIRSEILSKLVAALEPDDRLDDVIGYVADSGMGRWTVEEAIRLKVPVPAISVALCARFRSQQEESPAMQSIAALRGTIGGHPVKKREHSGSAE